MRNHLEYRKRVSYTLLVFVCLKLWISNLLHHLITKVCEVYVHKLIQKCHWWLLLTLFFYILCVYPETLWWFAPSWHFSLPGQCHLYLHSEYMVVLPACEGMKQFFAKPILYNICEAFPYLPVHTTRCTLPYHISLFKIQNSSSSEFSKACIWHCLYKIIVMRYIYNSLIKSALKAHRV
jgi:hypothetical protein